MWWPIVVVLTLLGVVGGVVSVKGAPWAATALLRVDISTNPIQSQQIVSTALQLVDSDPVYARVVGDSRTALNELRSRTTVGIRDAGAVLAVTVTAPTASQAELDADTFANQAVEFTRAIAQEQFTELTRLGGLALTEDGQLPDPEAEAQRRERVGTNLADGQDFALRSQTLVTRIGGVQTPRQLGVPANLAAPVGALVGALLGAIAALALGVRRRRIKRVGDLQAMLPGIRAYTEDNRADGLIRVAARAASLDQPLVAVLALRGAERHLDGTSREFERLLHQEGMTWDTVDADDLSTSSARAARLKWSTSTASSPAPRPDLTLVGGYADQHTVAQVAARADLVVVVAAARANRLGELVALCAEFTDNQPTIVLASGTAQQAAAAPHTKAPEQPAGAPRNGAAPARPENRTHDDRKRGAPSPMAWSGPGPAQPRWQTLPGDGVAAPQPGPDGHRPVPWTRYDGPPRPKAPYPIPAQSAPGPQAVTVPAMVPVSVAGEGNDRAADLQRAPTPSSNGSSNGSSRAPAGEQRPADAVPTAPAPVDEQGDGGTTADAGAAGAAVNKEPADETAADNTADGNTADDGTAEAEAAEQEAGEEPVSVPEDNPAEAPPTMAAASTDETPAAGDGGTTEAVPPSTPTVR